jgi:predicted RNA-binding protein with PUA-like domain
MNWLFKEEPTHYSFGDLERDGATAWSGVRNALAQKHLRSVKKGDRIFYYHTGGEKAIVGIAKAASDPYPDREDAALVVVDVRPVKALARPVSLADIKSSGRFASLPLVRVPRLSVMPIGDEDWKALESMSRAGGA